MSGREHGSGKREDRRVPFAGCGIFLRMTGRARAPWHHLRTFRLVGVAALAARAAGWLVDRLVSTVRRIDAAGPRIRDRRGVERVVFCAACRESKHERRRRRPGGHGDNGKRSKTASSFDPAGIGLAPTPFTPTIAAVFASGESAT